MFWLHLNICSTKFVNHGRIQSWKWENDRLHYILVQIFSNVSLLFFSGKTILEINDNTVFGTKTTMRLLSGRPGGTFSDRPCYLCGGDNPVPRCSVGPLWQQPREMSDFSFFEVKCYICTRRLVGSIDQACSSGFYFRIAWKSIEWSFFLWNYSQSFLQGLRSTNIK